MSEPITPNEIALTAPCKVNLTLDVLPPRGDGYHDLDSIVARFAPPADEIKTSVRPANTRRILFICKDKTLPKDGRNHAVRAAELFLDAFLPDAGVMVYIKLEKRLPKEAGLGGGSSDAATVLRALQHLFPEHASTEGLLPLASAIGSDVPLFLNDAPLVRIEGRGERVTPLKTALPPLYGILVKPEGGVPTRPAYALLDTLPNRTPGDATARLLNALLHGNIEEIGAAMGNDFEAAVLPHYPEVMAAHRAVADAGAVRTLLCGSGSAIFGLARDRNHARELAIALAGRFPWVKMAVGQDR